MARDSIGKGGMNRREFAQRAGALALLPSYDKAHPDMLARYLVERLNRLAAEWDLKRAAIVTPAALNATAPSANKWWKWWAAFQSATRWGPRW